MKRLILAAGVAALAITVPAAAKPGENGGGKPAAAKQKGGGKAQVRAQAKGKAQARAQVQRKAQVKGKAQARAKVQAKSRVAARSDDRVRQPKRAEQRAKVADRRVDTAKKAREQRVEANKRLAERRSDVNKRIAERRVEGNKRIADQRAKFVEQTRNQRVNVAARRDARFERLAERRRELNDRRWDSAWAQPRVVRAGWTDACPPGLVATANACIPPGQAKKFVGARLASLKDRVAFRELPTRLRYVYQDTPDYYYRYGDGYVYRVNRSNDVISSLLPLFGLGYTVGQPFPMNYSNYYMPTRLQSFYPDTPYTSYRYANGYVYQVDPVTGLIEDIDPMLGYGYGYGQMLPATYSAYNVPYQYRSLYADTSDYYYRYAPGAIYQVDPTTSLITAVAALLTNGMTVGQPLPAGYGAYNLPYQYRTTYYDTPDNWYRYANGNIYRVDPTTQLVTALVASALT